MVHCYKEMFRNNEVTPEIKILIGIYLLNAR